MALQTASKSMGTYKGNAGNLMQHWTLCELLVVAGQHTSGLNFIDAHAMAPHAHSRTSTDAEFDRVRSGLLNQHGSVYEQAWHSLAPNKGYPNSAAFVKEVWEGDFSLLLCEADCTTIEELRPWLKRINDSARCKRAELFTGDWRERFAQGVPSASEVGPADGSLTLVSFDPYMYNRRTGVKTRNKENLYPEDIKQAIDAMSSLKGGILIQLSTYDTNDNNPQEAVISSIDSILTTSDFTRCGVVSVNRKMMSLVYARNVPWLRELENLPDRFRKWRTIITNSLD